MGWWDALGSDGTEQEETKYASDFEGLASGPRASFSFEEQEGIPVDGSSKSARNYSPFTLRIIPPSLGDLPAEFVGKAGMDVDLYGAAGSSMASNEEAASSILAAYGISGVSPPATVANTLNQQIAAGQYLNTASGNQIRITLADSATAMDIAAQIAQILDTPPLTLLVNPNSMSISYQGIQSYQERGREGFIFQRWGEQQPTIKFSGQTGAFIAGESGGGIANASIQAFKEEGTTATPTGVQFASKRNSAAFQNFQALYQLYRNNGYIYDRLGKSEANLAIGAIAIDYDQWTYVGHIESFEYSYDATQIHALEWSMEFVVDVMYDNAQAPYAVLPLIAPTPNPSDPGGSSGGGGARGNTAGGWFNVSGSEDSTSVFSGWGEEFGVPPIPLEGEPSSGFAGFDRTAVVENPDGSLTLTNPNVGDG
jgi:hypothetical protein